MDPGAQKDERPRWLTHNGQFTHKVATCPAICQAQDRESSPVKDQRSTTVLRRQNIRKNNKVIRK